MRLTIQRSFFYVVIALLIQACSHHPAKPDEARSVANAADAGNCEALTSSTKPKLGEQYCRPNERQEFEAQMAEITRLQEQAKLEKNSGVIRRGFHAKHHGCLVGVLTVEETLPLRAMAGLFKNPAQQYKVIARFSNGVGFEQPDREPDVRGLAVKVLGRFKDGKLSDSEDVRTQDFIMTNQPVAVGANSVEFMAFATANAAGLKELAEFGNQHPRSRHVLEKITLHQPTMASMATEFFWGGSPYRLGPAQAVKFLVRPLAKNPTGLSFIKELATRFIDDNYLRTDLLDRAKNSQIKYDFFIQYQKDPIKNSVEDGLTVWDEKLSVPDKVAQLTFFKQDFTTGDKQAYCERLSMNPWHGLNDHEPMGNLNRARKFVYMRSADNRSGQGGTPQEPTVADIEQIFGPFQDQL